VWLLAKKKFKFCIDCSNEFIVKSNCHKRCTSCARKQDVKHTNNWKVANRTHIRALSRGYIQNPIAKAKRAANEMRRYAKKKNAVPLWFNDSEVKYIYKLARERNLEVDHIVPLTSNKVCGLHVQDNLRCIPKIMNIKKSNKYWPDMWEYAA